MKSLAILGSTGSIGNSTLRIYKKNKSKFKLISLSANKNIKKLVSQCNKFKPKHIFLINNNAKINNKRFLYFDDFIKKQKKKIDFVVSGLSGYEALEANIKLLKITKNLLIANKETIICGGKIFLNLAKKNKCNIIPIDSEHHCINLYLKNIKNDKLIDNIYLTASGGPFLKKKINYKSKLNQVLKHPTWKMGKKISVDSSTMANKVLELFEASLLFDLKKNKYDILIEQTSNVHAIIKLKNNILIPIIHKPSMEIPIINSLNIFNNQKLDIKNLKFAIHRPNTDKFPLINLGKKVLNIYGHFAMIVFTVYNEKLVKLYLENKINYGDISNSLVKAFNQKKIINILKTKIENLNDIKKAITFAKNINL